VKAWIVFCSSLLVLSAASAEEPLDAERPLACAIAQAAECDEAAQCDAVTLEQISVPTALRIDFAGKRIASADGERSSPIAAFEVLEPVLVLQGHQQGRGWTMVIDRASGHLIATLADREGAFTLTGGCRAE